MKINAIGRFKLILVILSCSSIYLLSQDSYIKNRLNFKLGYSKVSNTEFYFNNALKDDFSYENTPVGNLRLNINYGINNFIEIGPYFGYSIYDTRTIGIVTGTQYTETDTIEYVDTGYIGTNFAHSLFYGINTNIHILPFFINAANFRFDIYCSLQLGGIHLIEPEGSINKKKNYWEYGIYGGLAFYPFKHAGLYAEYGYGKYEKFRFGLGWKF